MPISTIHSIEIIRSYHTYTIPASSRLFFFSFLISTSSMMGSGARIREVLFSLHQLLLRSSSEAQHAYQVFAVCFCMPFFDPFELVFGNEFPVVETNVYAHVEIIGELLWCMVVKFLYSYLYW